MYKNRTIFNCFLEEERNEAFKISKEKTCKVLMNKQTGDLHNYYKVCLIFRQPVAEHNVM